MAPFVISHCLLQGYLAHCSFRFTDGAPRCATGSSEVPWDTVGSLPFLEVLQKSSSGEGILQLIREFESN